jgi:hypothetical protein
MRALKTTLIIVACILSAYRISGMRDHYYLPICIYGIILIVMMWCGLLEKTKCAAHLIWFLICVSVALAIYEWGKYQKWRADEAELQLRLSEKERR